MKKELTEDQKKSFWNRVEIKTEQECWAWTKGKNGKGINAYGCVWFNRIKIKAHRLAYELINGQIPEGMMICHRCDNPSCCNPSHLFAGTAKENAQDSLSKGRFKKETGDNRYNSKLTAEIVAKLKADAPNRTYGWGRRMAKLYGVAPTAINNAIMGRRWKHVT